MKNLNETFFELETNWIVDLEKGRIVADIVQLNNQVIVCFMAS